MGVFYVLEFGGQHTDLIGNRLTGLGHRVKYAKSNTPVHQMSDADGIILSGGPKSVYQPDSYPYHPSIFTSSKPVLGICYGMHVIAHRHGGEVFGGRGEYGWTRMTITKPHQLFQGVPIESIVWMNHGDSVSGIDESNVFAKSDKNIVSIGFGNQLAIQFHPELTHTEYGNTILRNFAEKICGAIHNQIKLEDFNEREYVARERAEIRKIVGKKKGLIFLSGGVDSTVAYSLAIRSGISLIGVHLDMGIERKGEAKTVKNYLQEISGKEVHVLDNSERLFNSLSGLIDPEDKRKTFQNLYDQSVLEVLEKFDLDKEDVVFIDGTLATDRRESGKEAAKKTSEDAGTVARIKTHHNVRGEDSYRKDIKSVEPLRFLSKDGARRLARYLDLPDYIINRPPFPGPGLLVRLITGVHSYPEELESRVSEIAAGHYLHGYTLPIKTVGLKGDNRTFEHLALVTGYRNWDSVNLTQKHMAEELSINRTVYWDRTWGRNGFDPTQLADIKKGIEFNRFNISLLKEATEITENLFSEHGVKYDQLPVIAFPSNDGAVVIAVRDVNSVDFRSVRPLRKPDEMPWKLCDKIATAILSSPNVAKFGQVDAVVLDASTKPAATTEWE